MSCETIVYGPYGRPQNCGAPAVHVLEGRPFCHPHFVASMQPMRQYSMTVVDRAEQHFRDVLKSIMDAPNLPPTTLEVP